MWTDSHRKTAADNLRKELIKKHLIENSSASNSIIKKILLENLKVEYKCKECGLGEIWNNKPIKLALDHINGNCTDNRPQNLRFLCHNCHSQTDTFCGAGNTGKTKVSDEDLLEAIKNTNSIRQALIKVGLSPRGLNYKRVYKLQARVG